MVETRHTLTRGLAALISMACCMAWSLGAAAQPESSRHAAREELVRTGTPFTHEAFLARCLEGRLDAVELFIRAGMEPDVEDSRGRTPLSYAAAAGNVALMERLLEAGARVDARDMHGATPLTYAVSEGHRDAVDRLLAAGADPNSVDSFHGWTPIMLAAFEGHPNIVGMLIEAGGDVNYQEPDRGFSALMYAAFQGHPTVVERLLEAGVDDKATNIFGETARDLADRRGLTDMKRRPLGGSLASRTSKPRDVLAGSTPLFAAHEPIELVLTVTLDELVQDVGDDRIEHPALITYSGPDGSVQSQPVEVRTRGKYRRRPDNCPFPPLRLDFEKSSVEGTLFQGLDKVKLVTHCRTDDAEFEQYVLQEYGLYRAYHALTSQSFRVRLVRMTYRDVAGRHPDLTRSAFIIEDIESVAARHGIRSVAKEGVSYDDLDFVQLTLLHLFEYMIGNIDWNVSMLQNVALIAPAEDGPFSPVPYDFDLAAIIDSPGADRHPLFGPSALRHVLFSDYCGSEDDLQTALELFRVKRSVIYAGFEDIAGLARETVQRTHRYLDHFYRTIDDPESVEREFLRPCRTRP